MIGEKLVEKGLEVAASAVSWVTGKRARAAAVDHDLKALRERAQRVRMRLDDAEQRLRIEDTSVLHWLAELRAFAFDAEDLDEEYDTCSKAPQSLPSSSSAAASSLLVPWDQYKLSVANRINEINARYKDICDDRKDLRIMAGEATPAAALPREPEPAESGSILGMSRIHGRHHEKATLIEWLRTPSYGVHNIPVISIVGEGGIGKTTLARDIFHNDHVLGLFPLRIWICASQRLDAREVTKQIIQSVTEMDCGLSTLDMLQRRLQELVREKKFLLVLDSVWTEDPRFWETLKVPLIGAKSESKILITTRSQVVSRIMGATNSLPLTGLEDSSCWFVLCDQAFSQDARNVPHNLVGVSKEIARKCNGLPLAAKWLGKTLHTVTDEQYWHRLSNEMPNPREMVDNILPVLRLSYELLPLHLKHCFRYCSIFPKDYQFDQDDLVKLWSAEGLIEAGRPRGFLTIEDIGRKYFSDLLWRSFFQPRDIQKDKQKYIMPTVIHDLAVSVSKHECLRVSHLGVEHGEHGRARYALLFHPHTRAGAWREIYRNVHLRTLIVYSGSGMPIRDVPPELFKTLKCLRVLDLSHSEVDKLPDSLGDLLHLRLLNLHGSKVEKLPETVKNLHNLQMLELSDCYNLKELPKGICSLVKICHIGLGVNLEKWDRNDLISMPPGIGRLTSLQTLSRFVVGSGQGYGIEELKDLNLRGELCISKLENVLNVTDARDAKLGSKQHIKFLMFRWSNRTCVDSQNEEEVLKLLCPSTMIKSLWVECYSGARFPLWLEDPSFLNLETLKLLKCWVCEHLPHLGNLPQLKNLYIEGLHQLTDLDHMFYMDDHSVPFPSLKVLNLSDLPNLLALFQQGCDGLSQLSELVISNCPALRNVFFLPPGLQKLQIRYCPMLMRLPMAQSLRDLVVEGTNWAIIKWIQQLTSLSSLSLCNIPGLKYIFGDYLGHLTALTRLNIEGCNDLVSVAKNESLLNLSSLRHLDISSCPRLDSFADKGLPVTLGKIRLQYLQCLSFLPQGLHLLHSLHTLQMESIPVLRTLPALPANLQYLHINGCPVLQERCQRGHEDWPIIHHVPYRYIGGASQI